MGHKRYLNGAKVEHEWNTGRLRGIQAAGDGHEVVLNRCNLHESSVALSFVEGKGWFWGCGKNRGPALVS